MKIKKMYLIPLVFFLFIIIAFPFTKVAAYSTGVASVDRFRSESVDIYQLITINYTVVGVGGSAIATIKSDCSLSEQVQANAIGDLGSENRFELIPTMESVYNMDAWDILEWDHGNYTETTWLAHETYINGTRRMYNVTDIVTNASYISPEVFTGYRYQAVLLPPRDVANQWCTDHGAVLNSVDAINLTIEANPQLVKGLSIQISEEMEPDTNLADGYDGIPVSAPIAPLIIAAIAFLIKAIAVALLAVGVGFGVAAVVGSFLGNPLIDRSTTVYDDDAQTLNVNWTTPTINQTELWSQYEDWCGVAGVTPTVEGYYTWLDEYFTAVEKVTPELPGMSINENWTLGQDDEGGGFLTMITGFLEDIMPIIIMIVIIIAMVWGIGLIARFMGKGKD